MSQTFLSIVIPCYKEEKRVHKSLEAIEKYAKGKDFEIEVLVMLDGTPDDTFGAAKKFEGKVPNLIINDRKKNMGKGYTVKEGMLKAKGKYIIFLDADNSTPFEQVDELLRYTSGFEVVIGSRYAEGGKFARPQSMVRRLGSRVLNIVIRTLAVSGIKDTQCGFKLFEHNASKEIFKQMTFDRWSFDIEVLAIARKLGYKIKEVGITWYDDPHSVLNPFDAGFKMIRDSWVVRKNILKGKYKP
jgi:dolichyl-phosphate beta-glucosyltransferase